MIFRTTKIPLPPFIPFTVLLLLVLPALGSPFEESARICVLVATEKDAGILERASTSPPKRTVSAGWSIRELTISGKKVLLAKAGRGPAEASASATAILAASPSPWYLISATPAAGLCGQSSGQVLVVGSTASLLSGKSESYDLTRKFPKTIQASPDASLCSVDSFVSSDAEALSLSESGYCLVDMGGHWFSSAAARASATHIPIRVISDDAGNDAGSRFREFLSEYEGDAGQTVLEMIASLSIPANSIMAHENLAREVSPDKKPTESVD
jgi:nucleoside phosphorylase